MRCDECFYWSDMIAFVEHDEVKAMCLSNGPKKHEYTSRKDSCNAFCELPFDFLGAVDSPARLALEQSNDNPK